MRAVPLIVRSVKVGVSVEAPATSFDVDLHRHLHILVRKDNRLEFERKANLFVIDHVGNNSVANSSTVYRMIN